MKKITILGIACIDIFVSGYSKIPSLGKLEYTDKMNIFTGGCALNCAIDLKKIGYNSDLIIPIGNDLFGREILKSLRTKKIPTKNIIIFEKESTSSSIVLLDKSGERSFLHNPGANAILDMGDINLDIIKQSDVLFIGGALLMPNFDGFQMKEVLQYAKQNNVYTVLDIGWDPTNKWLDTLGDLLQYVDLFVPSVDEAIMLSGTENLSSINKFFKKTGVKQLIIKLGSKGAAYFENNTPIIVPTKKIENPKDTTGAGDAFLSGVLVGIIEEWDMEKIIKFANIVGSECVQDYGSSSGIKDFKYLINKLN